MEIASDNRSGLARAMEIVRVLGDHSPTPLGVSEIARITGLSKSVVYRIVKELVALDFLSFDDSTKLYKLGGFAVIVGMAALRGLEVDEVARPHLDRLSKATGETSTLSVLEGIERVYIRQVRSTHEINMSVTLGVKYPLHAGASSKAILATFPTERLNEYLQEVEMRALTGITITDVDQLKDELAHVRERGYAVSFGERQEGSASVAAALFNADGDVVGSISVSGPLSRFPSSIQVRYGELVKAEAHAISTELGYDG